MKIIARKISVNAGSLLDHTARAQFMAMTARRLRDEAINAGEASPVYRTLVDGQEGVPEERIKPGGAIIYRFNIIGQGAIFALTYAKERSPVGPTGKYRHAWVAMVDGRPWTAPLNEIPPNAEVIIVNSAPYHRKIHVGSIKTVGYHIVEDLRRAVRSRFPNLNATIIFAELQGNISGFATPYLLKQDWGRAGRRRGDRITYPALVITARAGLG